MIPVFVLALCLLSASSHCASAAAADSACEAIDSQYPRQYIAYKTQRPPVLDGKLDDPEWEEVAWTDPFLDISGPNYPTPRFLSLAKLRWDDTHLYVGGYMEEPQVWATLTQHDSVIFQDNDFEFFVDPDLSHHYYKEYEMNAYNTSWSLCLDRPYMNGGYENSSRVFPKHGWDDYGLKSAVHVDGTINNPKLGSKAWSVEVAFPLAHLVYNTSASLPPKNGSYWGINFSRVEWHVQVVNNSYVKVPNVAEDNWVLAPTYEVDIHLPEFWAYLQFSDGHVNTTDVVPDADFRIRFVAMQLYYAEVAYKSKTGAYTEDLDALQPYVPQLSTLSCEANHKVTVNQGGGFTARVQDSRGHVCTVDDTRLVRVTAA